MRKGFSCFTFVGEERPTDKEEIYLLSGRQLDAKIAEHFFGYKDVKFWSKDAADTFFKTIHDEFGSEVLVGTKDGDLQIIPKYSEKPELVIQVIEKWYGLGDHLRIDYCAMGSGEPEYSATIIDTDIGGSDEIYKVRGKTIGDAVCKAVLLHDLNYPWDKPSSTSKCRNSNAIFTSSHEPDAFFNAYNLLEKYPHIREKWVTEYLEDRETGKDVRTNGDTIILCLKGGVDSVSRFKKRVLNYVKSEIEDGHICEKIVKEFERSGSLECFIEVKAVNGFADEIDTYFREIVGAKE
jgi:hypothetical protein